MLSVVLSSGGSPVDGVVSVYLALRIDPAIDLGDPFPKQRAATSL
jgi:hypothetical protein